MKDLEIRKTGKLELFRSFYSNDGSIKYVLSTQDSRGIEAVYLPFERSSDGSSISRNVVCLSSQVGCPAGCVFCETGKMAHPRNLGKDELVSELVLIKKDLARSDKTIDSVVMMGMGEPLLNLNNVLDFYDIAKENPNIKKFSVSTVGIIPGIQRLRAANKDIGLYISVHTPFNDERSKIIPVNRKYPIDAVIDEAKKYSMAREKKVYANYILINGVNDTEQHLEALSSLLDPIHFEITINLLNPISGSELKPSSATKLLIFKQYLESSGFTTDIRLSKGTDVAGGCGQLAFNNSVE